MQGFTVYPSRAPACLGVHLFWESCYISDNSIYTGHTYTKKCHLLFVWNSNLSRCLLVLCMKYGNPFLRHRDDVAKPGGSAEERICCWNVLGGGQAAANNGTILRMPLQCPDPSVNRPTLKTLFEELLGKIIHS